MGLKKNRILKNKFLEKEGLLQQTNPDLGLKTCF